ncbi:MAG: ABC transporter permease [Candidatus Rokubacteria bacterium]|nr:ABC transporter permease [Candidatus Rokubacteria bacterium]
MSEAGTARDAAVLPGAVVGRPRRARLIQALRRTPVAIIGATMVSVVILVALAAPVLAPHDPVAQIAQPLLPPGGEFLAGTDEFGRDELSRLIYGARVSLYVGVLAVLIALAVGGTSGVVAGFHGGFIDDATMRAMDILLSMPALVLAIAITAVLGPSLTNVMLAIGIVYSPTFARVARGPALAVVRRPYIEAARAIGASSLAIVLRHVLPNVAAPILVQATVSLSTAILTEAALSFLGLGTQPPTASWGLMLSAARQYMLIDPWIAVLPGLAIAVAVLGFNLLGDGLRDVLDPQMPAQ